MIPRQTRVVGGLLLVVACTSGPAEVEVGAGSGQVALLGDAVVAARAGQSVTIRHAGEVVLDAEAPVTHAFLGGVSGAELPPLFIPLADGLIPNPAVWGPCRGGDPAAAEGDCPVPPPDAPEAWDGAGYWSTGAMVPGDTHDLPLADTLADGDYSLVCALHPALEITVRAGGEAAPAERDDEAASDAAVDEAGEHAADLAPATVMAGVAVDEPPAYVAGFFPPSVRIPIGSSVTWHAGARTPVDVVFGVDGEELSLSHTRPADGLPEGHADAWNGRGVLRSGFLSADAGAGATASEWTVTFTRAGTYRYASRFGDDMTGRIVVEEVRR